ncbi:MAG: hypothetical protein KIS89_00415 [Dokdonella sp.]|nr:hypothetical protein [Dokdonella sp.]
MRFKKPSPNQHDAIIGPVGIALAMERRERMRRKVPVRGKPSARVMHVVVIHRNPMWQRSRDRRRPLATAPDGWSRRDAGTSLADSCKFRAVIGAGHRRDEGRHTDHAGPSHDADAIRSQAFTAAFDSGHVTAHGAGCASETIARST